MNFSTYQNKLFEAIEIALNKDKKNMIGDFIRILANAETLFKTGNLEFWISQLGSHSWNDIPITKFGLKMAKSDLESLRESDRNSFPVAVNDMCLYLFTYCNESDFGPEQYDYHYYFSINEDVVYKDCGTAIIPRIVRPVSGEYRIALRSELSKDENEFTA